MRPQRVKPKEPVARTINYKKELSKFMLDYFKQIKYDKSYELEQAEHKYWKELIEQAEEKKND